MSRMLRPTVYLPTSTTKRVQTRTTTLWMSSSAHYTAWPRPMLPRPTTANGAAASTCSLLDPTVITRQLLLSHLLATISSHYPLQSTHLSLTVKVREDSSSRSTCLPTVRAYVPPPVISKLSTTRALLSTTVTTRVVFTQTCTT
jgi:hypothetical protein